MKKLFLPIFFAYLLSLNFGARATSTTITLSVLAPMRVLDPKVIAQFEKENGCQVAVEFTSDHNGYESHLKSEIHVFDVVIADEKSLIQLTATNMLRTLPENLKQSNNFTNPLQVKTVFNAETNTYAPLFVNPMGIAYNPLVSRIPINPTWNMLIDSEKNPYWRQHVFITPETTKQVALAILATHEPVTHSKKISVNTAQWLSKLRTQRVFIDEPLELGFLNQHVNAAVLFYSDYIRYKNLLPNLNFVIPQDGTYFDRLGIGWCISSIQEKLAQKFIAFMIQNSPKFARFNGLIDIKYPDKSDILIQMGNHIKSHDFNSWILYDESSILPSLPAQGADR